MSQLEYAKNIGFPDLPKGDPDLCGDGTYHAWYPAEDGLRYCLDCPATRRSSQWTSSELGPDDCLSKHSSGVPCHFLIGHEDRGQPLHFNSLVGTWTS